MASYQKTKEELTQLDDSVAMLKSTSFAMSFDQQEQTSGIEKTTIQDDFSETNNVKIDYEPDILKKNIKEEDDFALHYPKKKDENYNQAIDKKYAYDEVAEYKEPTEIKEVNNHDAPKTISMIREDVANAVKQNNMIAEQPEKPLSHKPNFGFGSQAGLRKQVFGKK